MRHELDFGMLVDRQTCMTDRQTCMTDRQTCIHDRQTDIHQQTKKTCLGSQTDMHDRHTYRQTDIHGQTDRHEYFNYIYYLYVIIYNIYM